MLPPSGENHAASPRHIGSTSAGPPSTGTVYTRSKSDRKSTRLNSSHGYISYAVFCLKKKIDKILRHLLVVTVCGPLGALDAVASGTVAFLRSTKASDVHRAVSAPVTDSSPADTDSQS